MLKILAEKFSLRAFMASRKASRKFSQASQKPEKLRLGLISVLDLSFSEEDDPGISSILTVSIRRE